MKDIIHSFKVQSCVLKHIRTGKGATCKSEVCFEERFQPNVFQHNTYLQCVYSVRARMRMDIFLSTGTKNDTLISTFTGHCITITSTPAVLSSYAITQSFVWREY